jgi:hypothetical protein
MVLQEMKLVAKSSFSPLETLRKGAPIGVPDVFKLKDVSLIGVEEVVERENNNEEQNDGRQSVRAHFPLTYGLPRVRLVRNIAKQQQQKQQQPPPSSRQGLRIGVVLSGGQAPGGHNVIAGLFDFVKAWALDHALDPSAGALVGAPCTMHDAAPLSLPPMPVTILRPYTP